VAGTPVLLASGKQVPIQRVYVGTKVASVPQDGVRATARPEAVIALIRHLDPALYRMRVAGETILVTEAHPFFVAHQGWTQVRDLHAGIRLRTFSGASLSLASIKRLHGHDPLVYNFEVASTHTYFVGRSELLVHNCDPPMRWEPGNPPNIETGGPTNPNTGAPYFGQNPCTMIESPLCPWVTKAVVGGSVTSLGGWIYGHRDDNVGP